MFKFLLVPAFLLVSALGMPSTVNVATAAMQRPVYPDNSAGYKVYYRNIKTQKEYYYTYCTTYAAALRAVSYLNENPNIIAWKEAVYR
jgi:hypothetical protein